MRGTAGVGQIPFWMEEVKMVLERKAWSPEYRIRTELIVFGGGFTEPVGI